MFEEHFAQGTSVIHSLDPRVRLVVAAVCATGLAMARRPETAWLGLALAAMLLFMSRPPLRELFRRVVLVNVFILFLWLTVPLTMPGDPALSWGSLALSRQGIDLTMLVTLKSNAILWLFLALVASMDSPTLGHALARLRFPSKLVFLFLFTYRYLHVIADEWNRLRTAAALRGFVPRTGMHTYRTFAYMLGMVFVQSFERAGRVYEAMLLRGFSGVFRSVTRFEARPRDAVFALSMLVCAGALLVLEFSAEIFHA